jgi:hypothetical protein
MFKIFFPAFSHVCGRKYPCFSWPTFITITLNYPNLRSNLTAFYAYTSHKVASIIYRTKLSYIPFNLPFTNNCPYLINIALGKGPYLINTTLRKGPYFINIHSLGIGPYLINITLGKGPYLINITLRKGSYLINIALGKSPYLINIALGKGPYLINITLEDYNPYSKCQQSFPLIAITKKRCEPFIFCSQA